MSSHYITIAILYVIMTLVLVLSYDGVKNPAEENKREKQRKSVTSFKYYYRFCQLVYIYSLASFFVIGPQAVGSLFHDLSSLYLGAAISLLGTTLFVSAKLALGTNYSHCSNMYLPNDIITQGIYKYIRHPIYTANIISIFGLFVCTGSVIVLSVWVGMCFYYNRSARIEEDCLSESFEAYTTYKSKTGRFCPKAKIAA